MSIVDEIIALQQVWLCPNELRVHPGNLVLGAVTPFEVDGLLETVVRGTCICLLNCGEDADIALALTKTYLVEGCIVPFGLDLCTWTMGITMYFLVT